MRHLILSTILLLPLIINSQIELSSQMFDQIDNICNEVYQEKKFPGVGVHIIHKGEAIFSEGYGYADIENKNKIDPSSSLFRIGSVSKSFTSAALAILVEDGRIDLDAEVQDYVPYFPRKKYPVIVREVAGHLAGIRHYKGMEFMSNEEYDDVASSIEIFSADDLLHEPKSKYSYSSYGWNLISAVIEEAANVPFLEYMDKEVFSPLGMMDTHAEKASNQLDNLVSFYVKGQNTNNTLAPQVNNSYKWAGGGFLATVADVGKFADGILNNQLFSEEVRDEFWTAGKLSDGSPTTYGLGWFINQDDIGNFIVGHSGGSMGGTTMMLLYPDEELIIVTAINLSSAHNGLARKLGPVLIDYINEME